MKLKLYFLLVFIFALFTKSSLFAQDPGIRDTLYVDRVNGRLQPNTSHTTFVWGYHDEPLSGLKIPIKYKTNQTDVMLDSFRFHPDLGSPLIKDTVINRSDSTVNGIPGGAITMFAIWTDSLRAGDGPVDTFFVLYFTTGPSWDPAIYNPIDTFTWPSGSRLSFTDDQATDIIPYYNPPGNLDVRNDNRGHPTGRPTTFQLSQNYPNPFNNETVITFALPKTSNVKIEIFNTLGQKVRDLVDERVSAGYKRVVWDGKDSSGKAVASGIYLYLLKAGSFTEAKRMILLK